MVVSGSPPIASSQSNGAASAGKRQAVNITGRGSDVAFVIDEDATIEVVARELGVQLSGRGSLFSEGGVSVHTGRRILSAGERAAIRRVFEENSGLKVSRFVSPIGDYGLEHDLFPEETRRRHRWRYSAKQPSSPVGEPSRDLSDFSAGNQRHRTQAMVISSTFRSGESVRHYDDVVVLGDVNPGSEIMADGDIVVMGALKGLAHAGASGDSKAAIIALEIASPRIRIGDCEAVSQAEEMDNGDRKRRGRAQAGQPIIAYIHRRTIYVSPFVGRFARYTKGVPYDG